MKVTYHEIGGFAPVFRGCEVDTASLAANEAHELRALVEQSGVLTMGDLRRAGARDLVSVTITVEDEDRPHQAHFDLPAAPACVMPLVAYLRERGHDLLDAARRAGKTGPVEPPDQTS